MRKAKPILFNNIEGGDGVTRNDHSTKSHILTALGAEFCVPLSHQLGALDPGIFEI